MVSRRDFGKLALAALPLSAAVEGVRVGASTYSFRYLVRTPGKDNVDGVIAALPSSTMNPRRFIAVPAVFDFFAVYHNTMRLWEIPTPAKAAGFPGILHRGRPLVSRFGSSPEFSACS